MPKVPSIRSGKGISRSALCIDADGTRARKGHKIIRGADLDESYDTAILTIIELSRGANKIASAQGHFPSGAPAPGTFANPTFREPTPVFDADSNDDAATLGARYDNDSDDGSDDGIDSYELPRTSIMAQMREFSASQRKLKPSASRFQSWHNKMVEIFDLAYGTSPPDKAYTGKLECSCPPSRTSSSAAPSLSSSSHTADFSKPPLKRIRVFDIGQPYVLEGYCCHKDVVDRLIRLRLFPASPSRPEAAFTLRLLRWLQALVDRAGLGANMLADIIETFLQRGVEFQDTHTPYIVTDSLRKQLRNALTWLTVVERYADQMALQLKPTWLPNRPFIDDDDLELTIRDLAASCPACFQGFTGLQPPVSGGASFPQVIICIDGNFTQKRRHRPDTVSKQPFPPRRFLSKKQVEHAEQAWNAAQGSNPDQEACIASIRAIDFQATQSVHGHFDVTGLMGACCRHDVPLVFCDIRTPGERHYYATALIQAIIRALGSKLTHLGVAYDIGCRFAPSTRVDNLFAGTGVKISWAVPTFHVYGHTYTCQVKYNPRNLAGFGFAEGEGMERVWSGLTNLIGVHRNMSQGERRFSIEERLSFIASERRVGLFKLLRGKEVALDEAQRRAVTLLTTDFDPQSIPAQYRKDFSLPIQSESTTFSVSAPAAYAPPAHSVNSVGADLAPADGSAPNATVDPEALSKLVEFAAIDRNRLLTLARMSADRRVAVHQKRAGGPPTALMAVPSYCLELQRVLGDIQILEGLMSDRTSAIARGYKTTIRLSLSLKTEKAAARTLMKKINAALKAEHPEDAIDPPFQLQLSTLFHDDTFDIIEDWASEADPSDASPAWWKKKVTAKVINAFEELLRIGEERSRIEYERISARAWIKERLLALQKVENDRLSSAAENLVPTATATTGVRVTGDRDVAMAESSEQTDAVSVQPLDAQPQVTPHTVFRDALDDAERLRQHWEGLADHSRALLPRGGVVPVGIQADEDEAEHMDEILDAQIRHLAALDADDGEDDADSEEDE